MYMRASKDGKIKEFFNTLREIWDDHFPGLISPVDGGAEWKRTICEQMIWIGPVYGKEYATQDFNDWHYRMTIDFVRHRRYDVVITDEMRERVEKLPEEWLQEIIKQLEEDLEAGIYFS
ncbi:hypothetical protein DXG01_004107 [Tephrocybe rancida]|nr:hypothetical protein DXG01_004107 [Tephrocybe rancida]